MTVARPPQDFAFPEPDELLRFIKDANVAVTRREIARAFKINGDQRVRLKAALREMVDQGQIERSAAKAYSVAGALPKVGVLRIDEVSEAGTLYAVLEEGTGPKIRIIDDKPHGRHKLPALGHGDRVLARIEAGEKPKARIIKRLEKRLDDVVGVYRADPAVPGAGFVDPVDKKARHGFTIAADDSLDARNGELVRITPLASHRHQPLRPFAKVVERLGDVSAPRAISLIAIHSFDIPTEFSAATLKEAQQAKPPRLEAGVEDLRDIPFLTIDPEDARDHDDAVWAAADGDGWRVLVAIADVARYVTPGSALDHDARLRGNSCYFPDRVVPMLPEALSNDLCSLKAGKDRASLVAQLRFSAKGELTGHRFSRALIKVAANLSYGEVQRAQDGEGGRGEAMRDALIAPLYQAYEAVAAARDKRSPLALDLPERKIILAKDGEVLEIALRERFDAHRLIEDFMIAANVAAALALEQARTPLLYRVHEPPSFEKLEALRQFLDSLEFSAPLKLAKGQVIRPSLFNRILNAVHGHPIAEGVHEMVLRSQMQAVYSADNLGHFGLALSHYAHFTSPIRRYADLVVHRALIAGLKLGPGGLETQEIARLPDTAEHISQTERRAMAAERATTDRYLAAFYARHQGEVLSGRIGGVTRFGLFVKLLPGGGDGFLPIACLGRDYFIHDERRQALVGEATGDAFRLGDVIKVRVMEAEKISGSLKLELAGDAPAKLDPRKAKQQAQRRPTSRRRR